MSKNQNILPGYLTPNIHQSQYNQPSNNSNFRNKSQHKHIQYQKSYLHEIYGPYYTLQEEDGLQYDQQFAKFTETLENENFCRLYELVMENKALHSWADAIFYADKLATLTDGFAPYVYILGECFFLNTDFKKVHLLFQKYKVLNHNAHFQILAARALFKNKQYEQCINALEVNFEENINPKLEAQKNFLKGQCYESLENKQNAVYQYIECLKKDPTCHEAFKRMIDFYLLGNVGKEQLLTSLNFNQQDIWIKEYYLQRISEDTACKLDVSANANKNVMEDEIQNNNSLSQIKASNLYGILQQKNNIDLLCIKAKNCLSKYNIMRSYDICVKAIKSDPLYFDIIPVYCACLLHLNYLGELYYCAHNLVENYSTHPLSWFAIGSYYYLIAKYEIARKYFQKAIFLDRNFVYAWIGMAHSFAIQDESDQAMSFYRTVSRLFPGCYMAHLYMGMEYLRTNNLKTALLSFQYAKEINQNDPLIYNEIGVIYFKQKNYEEAKKTYLIALNLCSEAANSIVHTILNNLAHTYRKMKEYKLAIQSYEKCIQLEPKNYQTYLSLAYTYHISNQLNKAVAYYHKSLYHKHENQFAYDMLDKCLRDASENQWENVYDIKQD
ncbi:hypothetical protein IMG5_194480 [Ichthyophthirius multifiliis]|uniref:Uncharacterized protein n=1 Tax=Ichthyophthirius multifiliis TaxID=5932 RepID=G0R4S0_ICHMU|nr:hypothetical protein IMG5_194480 [Ichthyophthirius multifiliis]EGR27540.1 hypothetical protein IMG5_194480 [Ichthyophthirius multifiliis]|eukprot:XP_004024992.1 hypothetical protein IMG5_194480 [Ichthyophthirius multifiliis]